MHIHAVDKPQLPTFEMPARFRTDIAYFMTPAGERGVPWRCQKAGAAQTTPARRMLLVQQSHTIGRDPETLYAAWRDFAGLPRFMRHLESVTVLDERWRRGSTFVHAGWIEAVLWLGPERLLIGGFSNAREGGMVALLDPDYALPASVQGEAGDAPPEDRTPLVLLRDGLDAGRFDDLERVAALVSPAELGALLLDDAAAPSLARIDWLVAQGADLEARDADGDTAVFRLLGRGPGAVGLPLGGGGGCGGCRVRRVPPVRVSHGKVAEMQRRGAVHFHVLLRLDGVGNLILFGEWCYAVHSVVYDRLPDWFLGFDVHDRKAGTFWETARRDALLAELRLHPVPRLAKGRFSAEDLNRLLAGRSRVGGDKMEGIIVRQESGGLTSARAKLVRAEFAQAIAARPPQSSGGAASGSLAAPSRRHAAKSTNDPLTFSSTTPPRVP